MVRLSDIIYRLRLKRVAIPLIIGLILTVYIMWRSFDMETFRSIQWNHELFFFIALAFSTNIFRLFGYIWRLRIITDKFLSWKRSFQVISLWEFASTLTPGIVGGAAVALFFLTKEKISLGKSTAIVLLTGFVDEVIFIVILPILVLFLQSEVFISSGICEEASSLPILKYVENISIGTIIIYLVLLGFTLLMGYGLFINPRAVKKMFIGIARIRFLKKWKMQIIQSGDDVIYTSKEFKTKPLNFWIKLYASSLIAWIARFTLANVLVIAFGHEDPGHLLVYARQFVIWMMMLIPSTPGGTGIAEISFIAFMCEFFPNGIIATVTFFWRFISYYFFLILGVIILPRWVTRVYPRKPKDVDKRDSADS